MGPLHAYELASRLEQVADHPLMLYTGDALPRPRPTRTARVNQGHLASDGQPPGWKHSPSRPRGAAPSRDQAARWRRLSVFVNKLLTDDV